MIQELRRHSGVHAILCTGNRLAVPRILRGAPVGRIADFFAKEDIEDRGVSVDIDAAADVPAMMIDNPRRIFAD